jgi:flagellar biosynthetic protein FlhB
MADDTEREHTASDKRRSQFAEKGQVARSRELVGAMVLTAGAYLLSQRAHVYVTDVVRLTHAFIGDVQRPLDATLLYAFGGTFCGIVLPIALMGAAGALVSVLLQHRGTIPFRTPDFDLSRLDLIAKLQAMFKLRENLVNIATLLGKVGLLAIIFFVAAKGPLLSFVSRVPASIGSALHEAGGIFRSILLRGLFVSLLFGAIDFFLQWYRLEQRMKMSTSEVKQESKESQGDGQLKGRRKKMARDLLQRRSLQAVPKSDVVLVNPTHVAVAIKYDDATMAAPIVVAKGGDAMAERIRSAARRAGVPIVSQPPLARLLYAKVRVGRAVPADVYQAVAVVLAHCYRLRKRAA